MTAALLEKAPMGLAVVILAAGQGKRMKSDLPKVLQPLAGRPLLAHVLDTALALDAQRVQVVYGHGGELVRDALGSRPVEWVLQAEQLGTGHALAQALPAIADGERVLVLYGDVPLIRPATLAALVAAAAPGTLALLSVHLDDATGYGRVLRDKAGNVYRIVEQKDANRKEQAVCEANTGFLCAEAAALKRWLGALSNDNAQREYYLTDVVTRAVREGCSIVALAAGSREEVLGVNDKAQLAELEGCYRRARSRELLEAGVTLIDPSRVDVRGEVIVGRDVVLEPNVLLEGRVVLGDRVRLGPGVCVKDSEIGADTEVFAYSQVDGASVASACRVGPFARLRPGTRLAADVHVGNFVEIKLSSLDVGAKANHLSYVGDAEVGARVNIGAGTITCNYDGYNKWRTVIGAGAFIGSGTMLVAPVAVGANATIGAGSTITRSAPPDTLTVERGRQQSLSHWHGPTKVSDADKAAREAEALAPQPAPK
jgi:bifunctional UDP-N-acetylglucosamine pyrophosphorylase / glucosamine-1-phosphate N-acetyltransferase